MRVTRKTKIRKTPAKPKTSRTSPRPSRSKTKMATDKSKHETSAHDAPKTSVQKAAETSRPAGSPPPAAMPGASSGPSANDTVPGNNNSGADGSTNPDVQKAGAVKGKIVVNGRTFDAKGEMNAGEIAALVGITGRARVQQHVEGQAPTPVSDERRIAVAGQTFSAQNVSA